MSFGNPYLGLAGLLALFDGVAAATGGRNYGDIRPWRARPVTGKTRWKREVAAGRPVHHRRNGRRRAAKWP